VRAVLGLVRLGGLAQDLGDLVLDLGVGAVGPLGGVAGQLGAVQRDGAKADQPGGGAQPQRGDQEAGQRLLVADPEPRDGHMVGRGVGGQNPEGDVLDAAALDLPGGPHAKAIGVQQHAEQQLGVVGGVAVPVVAVGPVEGRQVELVDHVQDEPGEVAGGEPVAQVGWEQERLVAVAAQEVVGHGACYRFTPITPNDLILNSVLPPGRAASPRTLAGREAAPDLGPSEAMARSQPSDVQAPDRVQRERRAVVDTVESFHQASAGELADVAHPQPLHHCTRPPVVPFGERHDLFRAKVLERQPQSRPADLGRIAASPPARPQDGAARRSTSRTAR
jgi:hypothetical protein